MSAVCLTVKQPYAAALVLGLKTIETRSWMTYHRGPLLVHAGQGRVHTREVDDLWERCGNLALVQGAIIGRVNLVDCRAATDDDAARAFCEIVSDLQSWIVAQPQVFEQFMSMSGRLSLWRLPE
jgi:hypothetical protein